MSARYGTPILLRSRLDVLLLVLADTTPGVVGYSVYSPTIRYHDGLQECSTDFTISVEFEGRRQEYWGSMKPETHVDSPKECARRAHATHVGATYRGYSERELSANRTALKNRQTLQSDLARWRPFDTSKLEAALMKNLESGSQVELCRLPALVGSPEPETRLAAFRLVAKGMLDSELDSELIRPNWRIWRRGPNA